MLLPRLRVLFCWPPTKEMALLVGAVRLLRIFFLLFHYPFKLGALAEVGQFGTHCFPTHHFNHIGEVQSYEIAENSDVVLP